MSVTPEVVALSLGFGPVAHSNLHLTTLTLGSQAGQVYTRGVLSPVLGLRWLTPGPAAYSPPCANHCWATWP